jgi:hypothetical protein
VSEWDDYESGPFCRHWYDPSDCDKRCATCGHNCAQHGFGDGASSDCLDGSCECEEWADPE